MATNIRRRSLASGAAWTLPTLLTASAAPALAASTPEEHVSTVCQTIRLGAYDSARDIYPASFTFGGVVPDVQNTLTVTVTYPAGTPCPVSLVGVVNSCDGLTGSGGTTCSSTTDASGQAVEQASHSVYGGYFTSQRAACGDCPFVADLTTGIPRGSTVTLSNVPRGENVLEDEPGPYWTYSFTLTDWGSTYPGVNTVSMTNLDAPLNVVNTN